MHFKKLELVGFKSFCDKTTLNFEPGITAVVGPNGCGKSNIFDSIRWVLGEQSAKSLRGSEMQDVIFNGTDQKEPLGMAEVTLTFDNKGRFFNFDNDEMAITRRLFRSGESEYLLNKSQVRLKDIYDILLGTGVGAESYSIVAQGKIDLVLSSRPEDRRVVFDEASGITKYKSQKRETTRRLEETEQNLSRVNDIVTEVKRQIGSLERQANKARRYKEVFEELKGKEIRHALIEKKELHRQKEQLEAQIKEMEQKENELAGFIHEQEEKISHRQEQLKGHEENIMGLKNQIMALENTVVRNEERSAFNREKIGELEIAKKELLAGSQQAKERLLQDEEKLNNVRVEFDGLKKNIADKTAVFEEKEARLNELTANIRLSLAKIAEAKKAIMDLVTTIANKKNEIADFASKEQVYHSRLKRLEIEKAKVFEEKVITEESLNKITQEVNALKEGVTALNNRLALAKLDIENENTQLNNINNEIGDLEKDSLKLKSHKEFLEKLKSQYEDIGESMNALIYLDKLPVENTSGLVIKIKDSAPLTDEEKLQSATKFKFNGEAKPIELDTGKIEEKIRKLEQAIENLKGMRQQKETRLAEISGNASSIQDELRGQELSLANKESSRLTTEEQFNKIKEEEDIIVLELQDVNKEIEILKSNVLVSRQELDRLNGEHRLAEDSIIFEEDNISSGNKLREEVLVAITQIKTELSSLSKRLTTDQDTLRLLEEAYNHDKDMLVNIEKQVNDTDAKVGQLTSEILDCETQNADCRQQAETRKVELVEAVKKYDEVSAGSSDVVKKLESDRKALDELKNGTYRIQMNLKDLDYRYSTMKERMLSAYKLDLEAAQEAEEENPQIGLLTEEIDGLKKKLDSYGSVNLVAIEEYDELKARYDFLLQQQNDLLQAKESLHQAILKLNRTTKQMFMETFEKVREEFKNYFRALFNGGDAQVYLIDEQDPLESGIEIICRPPGKKLQNVLLLSGGEKSMAAIALIFAIFKVKPSPFCILDEIDAALDEANVDRFSRMLQEFSQTSQFIVVTHNKKTIANAGVMYGITMQQSGVSRIVSVKFAEKKPESKQEPEAVAA